jgi:hypothetical protein
MMRKRHAPFTSTPQGADIYVDGSFVGNAPAQLKLSHGKASDSDDKVYQEWSRMIEVLAGSEISLNAVLVAQP